MPWSLRLRREDTYALRGLRLKRGLRVCEQGQIVWLQGSELDGDLERVLRCLPAIERFRCDSHGVLYPERGRLPVGTLPSGPWRDLLHFLPLRAQPARCAPMAPERVPVQLVPAEEEREASLLLTPFATWKRWALTAPNARLAPLSFAVDAEGRALVRGLPLPPLPGRRFHEEAGVVVPCGLHWSPPVDAAVVGELFDLLPGELLLLGEDGSEIVGASVFVRATRCAVRVTAAGVVDSV